MAKRIMDDFVINEISGVTKPAQKGARMVIMKRDEGEMTDADPAQRAAKYDVAEIERIIAKGCYQLTTATDGHAHLVCLDDMTVMMGGGTTSSVQGDAYHSHPFVINDDGTVMIGAAAGHTHAMADPSAVASEIDEEMGEVMKRTFTAEQRREAASSGAAMGDGSYPIITKDDLKNAISSFGRAPAGKRKALAKHIRSRARALGATDMLPTDGVLASIMGKLETEGDIDMDAATLARTIALAEMNDAQKAHFGKLDAAGQEAFIKASGADREKIVKDAITKASEADPEVYRSTSGHIYRKSDDPRLVDMARERDADKAAMKAADDARLDAEAVTLAKSWTHMSGTVDEKTAKAKAILAASPEVKKAALDSIAEHAKLMAPLFKNIGAGGGMSEGVDANAKLDKLAKDHSAASGLTYEKAYDFVTSKTPEGRSLYEQLTTQ